MTCLDLSVIVISLLTITLVIKQLKLTRAQPHRHAILNSSKSLTPNKLNYTLLFNQCVTDYIFVMWG